MSAGVIDIVHERIHEGRSFIVTDVDVDVDIIAPKQWTLAAPNTDKQIHFAFDAFANAAGILELYEGPTITVAGTLMTAHNMNRNNAETASLIVRYDPTITVDGTKLWQTRLGVSGNLFVATGGGSSSRNEFILKKNTSYQMKFTSIADNNLVWVNFIWYELFMK